MGSNAELVERLDGIIGDSEAHAVSVDMPTLCQLRAALTRPSPIAGDVVERVARAIFSATSEWTQSHDNWDAMPDYGQDVFRDRARAAVSAMPTIEALQERVKVQAEAMAVFDSAFEDDPSDPETMLMDTVVFTVGDFRKLRAALSTKPTGQEIKGSENG